MDAVSSSRFWSAVLLSSVFGTNMGDFVARVLHLGHMDGVPPLATLFVLVLRAGRRFTRADGGMAEPCFWSAIAILRTGATNVADLADHDGHLGPALLLPLLGTAMAALAALDRRATPERSPLLLRLNASYWSTMLVAGVLGTVAGDAAEDLFGDPGACAVLAALFAPCLVLRCAGRLSGTAFYWLLVAIARTLGTAIGDALADRSGLGLGLPAATACTFLAFAGLLLLWRRRGHPAVTAPNILRGASRPDRTPDVAPPAPARS